MMAIKIVFLPEENGLELNDKPIKIDEADSTMLLALINRIMRKHLKKKRGGGINDG
jgi:hypothetical protein